MIACIVTTILALIWLGYESNWMRLRLPVGKITEVKEGTMTEPIGELSIGYIQPELMAMIKLAREETITLSEEVTVGQFRSKEVKVKTLRIGDGVYNGLILQKLISYIPKEASITLTNQPPRPKPNCHAVETAQLQCSWSYNGSKGSWHLLSGYGVNIYSLNYNGNLSKTYRFNQPAMAELPNEWILATTLVGFDHAYAIEQQKAREVKDVKVC